VLLHDFLDYQAREHPDRTFSEQGERRLSYREAAALSNRLARALLRAGVGHGDRFAYLAKNNLEYAVFFFAASRIGAVPVPLNYRLAPAELAYVVSDAGAELVVARGEYVQTIEGIRKDLPQARTFVAQDAPAPPGWVGLEEFAGVEQAAPPEARVSPDDDLYQMYTSGTTGRPKGAVLTQRAVLSQFMQQFVSVEVQHRDRVLVVAPLYHAAAAVTALGTSLGGGTLVIHEDFSPGEVVRALSEDAISRTTLVPAMIQACLAFVPDVADRSYDDLRLIVYGASPIAAETLRRAMEVFRCDFAQGYGMTETTAQLTLLTPEDHRRALRERPELLLSAGRPLPATEIRIVDAEGREVPRGGIGEVVARGPQLMRAYWNLPEATEEALRGGWLHTGDAGRMDAEGYITLEDRIKDMIVSGGENIYPREVENVLFEHPAVADVAVIGVPDERWGETVKAIVVLRPGAQATEEEIVEFSRGRLAGYKRPRSVDFVESLPRNPSGKVLKKVLREKYWAGRERRVS